MSDNQNLQNTDPEKEQIKETNDANIEKKEEDVIADYYDGVKELEKQGHESGIKKARNALYVTAVLVFVGELIGASMSNIPLTPLVIGIALLEGGVFAALAYWTKKKPFTAIIIGLILFVLLWVATIILAEGISKGSGFIIRIIIIVNLVQAIKPAKAWEDLQKR